MLLNKFIFNKDYYLANNTEVQEKVSKGEITAEEHWCTVGIHKGLVANSMFDVKYYLNSNTDLSKSFRKYYFFKDYEAAAKHWIEKGIAEGRNSSPTFHIKEYLNNHKDLQKAFGVNYIKVATHWVMHGEKEGRLAIKKEVAKAAPVPIKEPAKKAAEPKPKKKKKSIDEHIDDLFADYNKRKLVAKTRENELFQNELELESKYTNAPQNLKVSVVIPTYNRRELLGKAIDSVLKQVYRNFEIIVVDDGSTDGTLEFLQDQYHREIKYNVIKIVESGHKGVCVARNLGLENSTGEYIAYLDSDNEWLPNYLLLMVNTLTENKSFDSVYCGLLILDSTKDNYRVLYRDKFDEDLIRNSNYVDLNCFIHRRRLYDKLGGFNASLKRLVDWDLILKYTKNNAPFTLDAVLVKYHMLENILHISKTENLYDNYFKINDSWHGSQDVYKEHKNNPALTNNLPARKQNLKVGYVLWQFPVLSETFIINEIRWLVHQGYDVKVYYKEVPKKVAQLDFEVDSIVITDVDDLVEKLKADDRNILHGHFIYPTVTQLLYPAAEKAKIPFTFIGHGVDMFHYKNIQRMQLHKIAKSPYLKKIFAVGNFHRVFYMQHQVSEKKMTMGSQGIPMDFFGETEITFEHQFKNSVCCITRLIEKKGVEYLIKAAKQIPETTINIYGYGELEDALKDLAKAEGVENVHFRGILSNRDEVLDALKQNDLFVLPCVRAENGDMDGMPTVFMESLAAGVPVVTTNVSSISDIIVDGKTGFIAEPKDHNSLAQKIKEFYSQSKQAAYAMKLAGRKKVQLDHNIDVFMQRNVRIWQDKGLDIFLVSYNAYDELQEIVRRIYKYTTIDFHLTIVDNNSPDKRVREYLAELQTKVDNLNVVLLEENVFCGPASNIALENAKHEYAVYLCSKEGFILKHNWEWDMMKYMDHNPEVGIAGHISYSPSYFEAEDLKKVELFENFRNKKFIKENPTKKYKHVQGGIYILRNKMYQEIGGFNEKTPHDMMDVEYSYYVESKGWKLGSIENIYSLTVKTRPIIDSFIDESTIAAHPLTLENIDLLHNLKNYNTKKCNVCGWHGLAFDEKKGQHICKNCHSDDKYRTVYRFLAGSDLPYRKQKMLNTLPEFKGIGEIRKMFNYHSSTVEQLATLKESSFDVIVLQLDAALKKNEVNKILKATHSLLSEDGRIITLCANSDVLELAKETFKKSYSSVNYFNYNSASAMYNKDLILLAENKPDDLKVRFNDPYIIA